MTNNQCTECHLPWDDHTEAMREACRAGRVAGIKARVDAAGPGPWNSEGLIADDLFGNDEGPIGEAWYAPDYAFVTHARDDVPWLLSEVARLQRLAADAIANLTRTQTRCSELIDECRGWRQVFGRRNPFGKGTSESHSALSILGSVVRELWRATAKHGSVLQQSLPLGIGTPDAVAYEALAKERCDIARANGTITWSHVLDEEAAEVMGAKTPADARKEALQVACVAIRIVQAIDLGASK